MSGAFLKFPLSLSYMKRRLFTDMNVTPTDALLRKHLGIAFQYYETILQVSGGFRRQWQFSRGNGWLLKVDDTRKSLYYMIAFEDGIEVSLTVRDAERQHFSGNPKFEKLQVQLEAATKYAEGYALRFEIEKSADCNAVSEFLGALIELRRILPVSSQKPARAKKVTTGEQELGKVKAGVEKSNRT